MISNNIAHCKRDPYLKSGRQVCPKSIGKEHDLVIQPPASINLGRNAGPRST